MVKPFNHMNVDVSCLGNHELDFGIEKCKELIEKTKCPWIITNVQSKEKKEPICGLKDHFIKQC